MINKFQGETRWLSNFQVCNIEIDGKLYKTTEHAYQAFKTLDETEHEQIRNAATAGKAKRLGRKATLRSDWEDVKEEVMWYVNWLKFQDPELRQKLLDTGDEELVEGNTWGDTYWGVCKGKGKNRLGHILTQIRARIRNPKLTTDEWTEAHYGLFARDVDVHIKMLTDLNEDRAYQLRRLIMQSLRFGKCSAHQLTDRVSRAEAELAALKAFKE